jgi:type I restriction enzyme S subunit
LTTFFSDGDWIESKDQSPQGIRLVQTGNIGVGEYRDKADKARYISEATFKRLRCTDVLPGDCLVSRLPEPVGRACLVPDLGTRMITGVDCSIIRFDPKKLVPEFFVYYTRSREYLKEVEGQITGTTRARISRSNLGKVNVRFPSPDEQRKLLVALDELKEQTDALEATYQQKLRELEGLKKGLLGAAFRGEL